MSEDATGRIALITGANKGIGFEIARGLGQLGATVLIGARRADAGEAAAATLHGEGLDARFVPIDVTDAASIAAAAARIGREHGRLDILINNAAVSLNKGVPPSETDIALLRETYETNVFGLIAVTQAMLPLLKAAPAARIVNMSSGLGSLALTLTLGPTAPYVFNRLMAYTTSKTAVNAVTVQFAVELAETGIKINAASPVLSATELSGGRGSPPAEAAGIAIRLALIGPEGPTGGLYGDEGQVPW